MARFCDNITKNKRIRFVDGTVAFVYNFYMKKNNIIKQPSSKVRTFFQAAGIMLLVYVLFSGSILTGVKKEDSPSFQLIKIEKGCTRYKGDRGELKVKANLMSGQCRAELIFSDKCREEYLFRWKFHNVITQLKPGDKFKVTVSAKLLSPQCCKANPYITATGSYGSGAYLDSLKDLLKKEKSGGNIRGTTNRVYAKKISKANRIVGSKTTELRVWEGSKGDGIIWFKIKIATLSKNSCNYEIAYVYKDKAGD